MVELQRREAGKVVVVDLAATGAKVVDGVVLQTTLRYAEQTDATADAELRRWRRHKTTRR